MYRPQTPNTHTHTPLTPRETLLLNGFVNADNVENGTAARSVDCTVPAPSPFTSSPAPPLRPLSETAAAASIVAVAAAVSTVGTTAAAAAAPPGSTGDHEGGGEPPSEDITAGETSVELLVGRVTPDSTCRRIVMIWMEGHSII